jgi:hypothetical protein
MWFGGLEIKRLPRDRKVAGSILISGGGIKKKIRIRDLFFSHWSLGSEIQRLALSDNNNKQEVPCER